MKSSDLAERGLKTWRPFAIEAERELLSQLPTCHGVYSMRLIHA
jgi:hypothetical protein